MKIFIAVDENEVLMTLARKGLNSLPEILPKPKLPFAGWECSGCGFIMKVSSTKNGSCKSCWSPYLNEVYGQNILNEKFRAYNKFQKKVITEALKEQEGLLQ